MIDISVNTLGDILALEAELGADRVCHIDENGRRLTAGGWRERSTGLAHRYRRHLGEGEPVLLHLPQVAFLDFVVVHTAVQLAGAVPVPVAASAAPPARVRRLGERLRCRRVVTAPDGDLGSLPPPGGGPVPGRPVGGGWPPPGTAEILHTSGTTGEPKLVAVSHRNLVASVVGPGRARGAPGERAIHAYPLGTNGGQTMLAMPLRPERPTVLTMADFQPARFWALVRDLALDTAYLVPTMGRALLQAARAGGGGEHGRLAAVRFSGAPLPPSLVEEMLARWPGTAVTNLYSTSEAWPAHVATSYRRGVHGGVGTVTGARHVRVVDGARRPAPPGTPGHVELWSDEPRRHLAEGDGETRETHPGHGDRAPAGGDRPGGAPATGGAWVPTADVGYIDAESRLHLTGRSADLIVTGGLNVGALAVEDVLLRHPALDDACVVGIPHGSLGELVAAAVVLRPGVRFDARLVRALQEHCARNLGKHEVPKLLHEWPGELPRTGNGKVLKREVRARIEADMRSDPADAATSTEASLGALWTRALGVAEVSAGDGFIELGGDSISLLQVNALIAAAFGVELDPVEQLECRTLRDLAALVDRRREDARPAHDRPCSPSAVGR